MDICTSRFPDDCDGNNGATPDDRDEEMELTASTQRVSLSIFLFSVAKIACWMVVLLFCTSTRYI